MTNDAVTQVMAPTPSDSAELSLIVVRFDSDTIANPFAVRFSQEGGTIGRGDGNTLALADFPPFRVSGAHCRIAHLEGAFVAIDESRNGTFLNDESRRVSRSRGTQLMHGDRLLIGSYEILVVLVPREQRVKLRNAAEAAGRDIVLSELSTGSDDVDQAIAKAAASLTNFADVLSRLLTLKNEALSALDSGGASASVFGRDDANLIQADRRQLTALLLKRPGPKGPLASIDDVLEGLYGHQEALAASAWAGPQSLYFRWTPTSITRRCDRQFRFTGPESLDRKKKCMELFEADFTVPDPPALAPVEGDAPPPPAVVMFSPEAYARDKSVRAYNRFMKSRAVDRGRCGWPEPLPARLLTLTLVRVGGKPADAEVAPLQLLGQSGSIGRGSATTMCLPDPKLLLTRNHVEIEYVEGDYIAFDRSKNGTFINSRRHRIDPAIGRRLEDGDHLLLGDYELFVELSGGPFTNAFASQLGGALVDRLAQDCGLARADLPNMEPLEVFSLLSWRLRMLTEWLDKLQASRRMIHARFSGDATVKTDGAESLDAIFQQQEAMLPAMTAAISEIVRTTSPRRFLEMIDKKTIYRADTFWGEVFEGKQRIEAWNIFVDEKNSASPKAGESYFCNKLVGILNDANPAHGG
jgi:predicted component of type VI protein secretion system